jgi:hypothetical protein
MTAGNSFYTWRSDMLPHCLCEFLVKYLIYIKYFSTNRPVYNLYAVVQSVTGRWIYVNGFKVCKSVHHRTIQIKNQPDSTIFQFIILTFIYSSAYFGPFPANHQELNACSGSLWFCLRIVVTVVLCSWLGRPAGRPNHEHSTAITTIRR